ncbi:MAG TPA: FlgD immunoglobulin-like domain containing protein [Candidatus Krumholzibacteria bacterium]|nr:FlgD immunoglobulin-like domain containing protein [Candidatus Krumholzibacteria bacterium]HPD70268.1 FlgD immunoglobulin-like domain containing protein [Candidatus Krumholzibacteria bacterium]HRY40032.1 FlgD immunoglobulin-like domain containing protein [Candidatus Krumholzibacteria bacterium]
MSRTRGNSVIVPSGILVLVVCVAMAWPGYGAPRTVIERPSTLTEDLARPQGRTVGEGLNLSVLGRWAEGASNSILIAGDVAYHARGGIVEILAVGGEKRVPPSIGRIELPSLARSLAYRDGLLFVAGYHAGLWIADVADPTAPQVIGHLELEGIARGVTLRGDHAFVACGTPGFFVVDVSDPAQPVIATTVDPGGYVYDVAAAGDLMAVGCENRLRIYDISSPTAPVLVASESVSDSVVDVVIRDHLVYLAGFTAGLMIYDLTDPYHPVLTGTFDPYPWVTGIAVSGDLACATGSLVGFYLVDVSDPADPGFVSFVEDLSGDQNGVDFDGRLVYLANGGTGLEVWDAVDPAVPFLTYRIATFGNVLGLDVDGNVLGAACSSAGLLLVDVTDPGHLVALGTSPSPLPSWSVAIEGNRAIVAQNMHGFALIDVTDQAAPREVGRYFDGPEAQAMQARCRGDIAYLAYGSMGDVQTIDIRDLAHPVPLGRLANGDLSFDVDLGDDVACVADGYAGCLVVDIAEPADPKPIAVVETPGDAAGVSVSGHHAFVADRGGGLRIIDFGDQDAVVEISHLRFGVPVEAVAVEASYAYVCCGASGVRLVDVSDPAAPVEVGHFQTGCSAAAVRVQSGVVYVADRENGFWILRNDLIGTPVAFLGFTATRITGGCRLEWEVGPGFAAADFAVWRETAGGSRVAVGAVPFEPSGRHEFVDATAPASGLRYWLEVQGPGGESDWYGPALAPAARESVALACSPNPPNPATVFSFALPADGHARLEIVDLRGRRVTTLRDGSLAAGPHAVAWDGRDAAGRAVAAGIYLARLSGESFVRWLKVAIVR